MSNYHDYVARFFIVEGEPRTARNEMSRKFLHMAEDLLRELCGCYALEAVLQRLNYVRSHTLGTMEQWEQRLTQAPETPRVIPEPTTNVHAAQPPMQALGRLVPRWADETTKVLSEEERKQVGVEVDGPISRAWRGEDNPPKREETVLIVEEYGDPVDNTQSETVMIAEDKPQHHTAGDRMGDEKS